jgi:hypothetical protein
MPLRGVRHDKEVRLLLLLLLGRSALALRLLHWQYRV